MIDEKPDLDELEHYGVKGMKWGVRKQRDESARAEKFGKKKVSRKENRQLNKQASREFYENKANDILKEAGGKKVVLIKAYTGDAYPTLMEGKEFVKYMSDGGLLDVKRSDIYARQASDGVLEETGERSRTYKKKNFREE